jgi:hypothetical protein
MKRMQPQCFFLILQPSSFFFIKKAVNDGLPAIVVRLSAGSNFK